MDEWFKDWFDADYSALYDYRDEAEARKAVRTALAAAPQLASGPVLDLACGNGRHLQELRKVNPLAFGLDLSAHLLTLAPRDLRGWLLRGDMRHLPIREASMSGICLWFTPFGYFSDQENQTLLCQLRQCLQAGGILVLDLMNPRRVKARLVREDVVERNGLKVHSHRSLEGNRVVKRMTIERLDSGAVREAVESVRLYEIEELRAMTQACGLALIRELGGYDGSPFDVNDSERWLGILKKNSMADQ